MPGALTIKLIEANITHDTFRMITMSPYCVLTVGNQKATSEVSMKGGNHPHWDDNLTLQTLGEEKGLLELKDKHFFLPDFSIGSVELDLKELEQAKNLTKWLQIKHKDENAGEILVETSFIPGNFAIDEPVKQTVSAVIMKEHLFDRPEKVDYHQIIHDKQDKNESEEAEEKKEGDIHKPDYTGQGGFLHIEHHSSLERSEMIEQIDGEKGSSILREKQEKQENEENQEKQEKRESQEAQEIQGVHPTGLKGGSDFKPETKVTKELIDMTKEKENMDFSGRQQNRGVNEADLAKYSDYKPVVDDLVERNREKVQMDFSGKQGDSSKTQEGEPCDQRTNAGKE